MAIYSIKVATVKELPERHSAINLRSHRFELKDLKMFAFYFIFVSMHKFQMIYGIRTNYYMKLNKNVIKLSHPPFCCRSAGPSAHSSSGAPFSFLQRSTPASWPL